MLLNVYGRVMCDVIPECLYRESMGGWRKDWIPAKESRDDRRK